MVERARQIGEQRLGDTHPVVALSLEYLGVVRREQGRAAEAESLFRRSLAMSERTYGRDHTAVAQTLEHWAVLMERTGRANEASVLLERARTIRARAAQSITPAR